MNQYRITVGTAQGAILNTCPSEQWSNIADTVEERGYNATLERRLITDESILPLLTDRTGYINLKGKVFCPWEVIAELH